ncbi:MAG: hypothetical protein DCC69_06670 [Hyphomicrobiales bacterium]|nr:hypothetical protein [Alphaproteobacteria bacterium]RIK86620.1 MAG: hypothetical protein DCC69_06670 [Hyphomicrobiales bacterium]
MSSHQSLPLDANELSPELSRAFGVEEGWRFGITRASGWSDMDAYGHVNNLIFLDWCQEARTRYIRMMMGGWPAPTEAGPVVRTLDFTFSRSLKMYDRVLVTARVEKLGATSCVQTYGVWNDGLVGKGSAVCVFVDGGSGEKVSLPERFRKAVTRFEGLA